MNERPAHRRRGRRDAARRAIAREAAHVWRAARSLHHLGPGRNPGNVVSVEVRNEETIVRGWVGLPRRVAVSILVTVDGEVIATCATRHPTNPRTVMHRSEQRWAVTIPQGRVHPGERRFGAWAVFDGGLVEGLVPITCTIEVPITCTIEPPAFGPGDVDHPLPGATARPPTAVVTGWLLPDSGYDRIEAQLDDGPVQRARIMSTPRPDVAAHAAEPGAPLAGWELLLDVPDVHEPTSTELRVDAVGPAGRLALGRSVLELRPRSVSAVSDPDRLAVLAARADVETRGATTAMERPHLVVATHHLGLGGGQLYLQELLRHLLPRRDISCTVLAMADGVLRTDLELWGARVHIVGQVPGEGLQYEARMLELAALLAGRGMSCVLANTGGAFWGVDLAVRMGVPAIWAIHESFSLDHFLMVGLGGPDDHVAGHFIAAVETAAALVFEADATLRLYERTAAPGRCIRIDYGVDLDRIARVRTTRTRQEVRDQLGVPAEATLLLCLGTFEPRKSQGALALAFSRVAGSHPDAILALVGDIGTPYAAALHGVVERLDIGDRIRLEPVTPDIDDWYLAADGFILGSDVESLPRSMLEVMAYGVPVLGSAVFGVPELITDGETGLLFEPSCLGALTGVLDRFLSMPAHERRAIGEAGRRLVESTRAARFYGEAYSTLLDALLEDPMADPSEVLGRR